MQPEVRMVRRVDLEGAAHLVLATGVRHLDEATAVFDAMLFPGIGTGVVRRGRAGLLPLLA
jgi:hypothetical protein